MRIEVTGVVLERAPELRTHVERRLLATLGDLARHVDGVAVREEAAQLRPLERAYRCQLTARLAGGRELVEDEIDGDPYVAIDRAAEALARDVEYVESRLPPGGDLRCD